MSSLSGKIRRYLHFLPVQYYHLSNGLSHSMSQGNGNGPFSKISLLLNRGAYRLIGLLTLLMFLVWTLGSAYGGRDVIGGVGDAADSAAGYLDKLSSSFKSSTKTSNGGAGGLPDIISYYASKNTTTNDTTNFHLTVGEGVKQKTTDTLIDFDREHVKYIYPELIDYMYRHTDLNAVDWSKYAYILYATSAAHLCNSFMIFAELRQYGSQADMVLVVNEKFLNDRETYPDEYRQLEEQKLKLNLKYKPHSLVTQTDVAPEKKEWVSSYTKLMVFGATEYERVIYMDADAVLTKSHLDELFFLPPCKFAAPSGYWLIQENFNRDQNGMMTKYPAENYGWKPTTAKERSDRIWDFEQQYMAPFVNEETGHLPYQDIWNATTLKEKVNARNFQNMVYNNLPNYPFWDEFLLTNIVMVIQPDEEMYKMVLQGIEDKSDKEFDMDIMQRLFELNTVVKKHKESAAKEDQISFESRLVEKPEFLVLPHTAYGTLTQIFNVPGDSVYYYSDPHDQMWATNDDNRRLVQAQIDSGNPDYVPPYYNANDLTETPGEYMNRQVKYLHFSDAPIPKPWFWLDPQKGYMSNRKRCPLFREFVEEDKYRDYVKPGHTQDCTGGEIWEDARNMFAKFRKETCGLDLIKTDKNTYFDFIN